MRYVGEKMILSEYNTKRGEVLSKMNFSDMKNPFDIKILWFDNLVFDLMHEPISVGEHAHSFYEIHFNFCGTAVYVIGGVLQELCAGQAQFIPPGVNHRYISSSADMMRASLAFSLQESKKDWDLLFEGITFEKFVFEKQIAQNNEFILKICEKKDSFAVHLISGRIAEILYLVFNSLGIPLPYKSETEIDPRFLVAKSFIEKNTNRIISCDDVAKECCLSTKQLSRIVKKHTGKSLYEYITDCRLDYAIELLRQNEPSIKEISFMLGFENECSFNLFFKRHIGVPPGVYRKQKMSEK